MNIKNILFPAFILAVSAGFTACSEEDLSDEPSMIVTPNTETNDFDLWLTANFCKPYNIDYKYRYEHIEGDYSYYLVPARYEDAITMAHLIKYLCIETYNEVAGSDFTCSYFPKMFYTVGEWEYKNNGTFVLGSAEGGRKIFLAGLNYLSESVKDPQQLNEYYFKTIHHEFTHILNQTKPIPASFQTVTYSGYVSDMWSESPYNTEYLNNGFISNYAQHSYTEDFAEMVSIYVTNPASYWEETVGQANEDAQAAIAQKLDIVRNYMESNFGIDLDQLREVLQRRQQDVASGIVDLSDLSIN